MRDLLADLNDVIRERVAAAFDMQTLSREMGTREPSIHQASSYTSYRSKRGPGASDSSAQTALSQRWSTALWTRLETLVVGEMGAVCSKVYTLERVLSLKSDRMTGTNYLDEAMSILGDRPSAIFWATLSEAMEKQSRQGAQSSAFLTQTLSSSYPRLLRLFHEFFDKVAIYTDTVTYSPKGQSKVTLLMLASVGHLQENYLAQSKAKLDNYIATSFGPQRTASTAEGNAVARMAWEEVDRARFDPVLLRSVIHMLQGWLATVAQTIAEQCSRDITAYSLHYTATSPSQLANANLTSAVYSIRSGLRKLMEQGPSECKASIGGVLEDVDQFYHRDLVEALLHAILKEISDTIARMHYVDFGLPQDAVMGGSGGSAYMSDLSDRLWYVREQLLVHYHVESDKTTW